MKLNKKAGEIILSNQFADKNVVITGGARGIGKNIARIFGKHGAHIIICDINSDNCQITVEDLKKEKINADFILADLSKKGEPQQIIERVVNKWGKIDVLVNNARSGVRTTLFDETEDSWDQTLSVTLNAAFFTSREAIKQMSKTGGGAIVNISSVAGDLVCKESPSYHIAKAGISQLTRYLAAHAGIYNVRVNCVVPGFIIQDEHMNRFSADSNIHYKELADFCHPLGKTGTSDDVADAVLFLCSTQSRFITGQNIVVDGGLTIQEQSLLVFNFDKSEM